MKSHDRYRRTQLLWQIDHPRSFSDFFETEGAKTDKSYMNCFSLSEGAEQFEMPVSSTTCLRRVYRQRRFGRHQAAGQ